MVWESRILKPSKLSRGKIIITCAQVPALKTPLVCLLLFAGFIKTNATSTNNNHSVNYDSEDMSGSTSDSQSSIIHVMGPSNGGPSDPGDLSPSAKMNKPTSAVWSPYG